MQCTFLDMKRLVQNKFSNTCLPDFLNLVVVGYFADSEMKQQQMEWKDSGFPIPKKCIWAEIAEKVLI